MPSPERALNDRMRLRYCPEMLDLVSSLYPKTLDILSAKARVTGSMCTPGELRAAARYLAKSLAEYDLRRRKRVRDALYTPLDEVYWREDLALKSNSDNGALIEKIALARSIRSQHYQEPESGHGGAYSQLINAIRHAWLICHDGSESINYRRKSGPAGDCHWGPLPDFLSALSALVEFFPSEHWIHRHVRELDLKMHPALP